MIFLVYIILIGIYIRLGYSAYTYHVSIYQDYPKYSILRISHLVFSSVCYVFIGFFLIILAYLIHTL